jgi:lipopolysaccharide transport system permease protein
MLVRYSKEMLRSPFDVLANLYRYRHILMQMVVREIKGRFAGSMGGLFWHFAHPLLLLVVYIFVFIYIFKMRVGTSGESGASAVFLMSGLFPWIIFSEGLARGANSFIENATLIQKSSFPTEILTAKAVIAPVLSHGIALVLITAYKVIFHGFLGPLFLVPVVLLLQIFFTLGVSMLCAALAVFFRDIIQLTHVMISFWIFLTPILYPVDMLPAWAKKAMYSNPLYPFISLYHSLLMDGGLGQRHMVLLAVLWTSVFYVAGTFVFNKLKYEFADWL